MKVVLYPSRQQALYITYEQISNDRSISDNSIQRLGFEDKIRKKKKKILQFCPVAVGHENSDRAPGLNIIDGPDN